MPFNSALFLFAFLPIATAVYLLAGRPFRNVVALLASILFYAWAEPGFIWVVIASATADYLLGLRIVNPAAGLRSRRAALVCGVVANVGVLVYFKYAAFAVGSINGGLTLLHLAPFSVPATLLPIGVSFIVFEKITYLVDLYRGTGRPARSLSTYLLYVFFFPKLLAGPIIKYHEIDAQIDQRRLSINDMAAGLTRFSFGLWKKVFIADTLGRVVDPIFRFSDAELGFTHAWLGLIAFTMQIYFDFSGYSDMAIGLARMLGFHLRENFDHPYIAQNVTDFWRRWHISLSTWIREYLYIPLGGNRLYPARTYANLWICFLLSGLWHGAQWTFVLWGAYQGLFLVFDRVGWARQSSRLPKAFNIVITMTLVMFGWIIFRSESLSQIAWFTKALFTPGRTGAFLYITSDVYVFLVVGVLLSFIPAVLPREPQDSSNLPVAAALPAHTPLEPGLPQAWQLILAVPLLVWSAARIAGSTLTPFLYFRF